MVIPSPMTVIVFGVRCRAIASRTTGESSPRAAVFNHAGKRYLIVQGDDTDAAFDAAEDYVIRVNAIIGTLNATDIVLA